MARGDLWSGSLSPEEDEDQLPRAIWEDTTGDEAGRNGDNAGTLHFRITEYLRWTLDAARWTYW